MRRRCTVTNAPTVRPMPTRPTAIIAGSYQPGGVADQVADEATDADDQADDAEHGGPAAHAHELAQPGLAGGRTAGRSTELSPVPA